MSSVHCTECGKMLAATDEFCRHCGHQQAQSDQVYYPVSILKFAIISIVTFNLYLLYWFYQNWKYVNNQGDKRISAFWRTLFMNISCYALLRNINGDLRRRQEHSECADLNALPDALLALSFFLLISLSWRLPEPYWLVSLFSFVPLLFAVNDINALNGRESYHYRRNSRFSIVNFGLVLIGSPPLMILFAASFGIIPPAKVLSGDGLFYWQRIMIRDYSNLQSNEKIEYFYSDAIFKYETDGNVVTDKRVISYFTDDTGQFYHFSIEFDRINSIHVQWGTFFEPTLILVCTANGNYLVLYAGTEGEKDHQLVNAIRNQMPNSARFIVEKGKNLQCSVKSSL